MASSVTVRITKDTGGRGVQALFDRMKSLDRSVLVGVPSGAKEADGTSLALVAAVNEFGSRSRNIPERSFLRTAIVEGRRLFTRINVANMRSVLHGGMTAFRALDILGVAAVGKVKEKIATGRFVRNSPETIRRKGSSKPLIDTSQLQSSITHVHDANQQGLGIVR
jgi:hypothetical protein